jgi:hypothetical protein
MGYVLAVRANHAVSTGSGRTVTAAAAAGLIPARAWHRMRTGSGTKGTRQYEWAMLEVTSDDTPGGHGDGHSVLLARRHRYTGQLSFYRCWTPRPVPLSKLIAIAVARWRIGAVARRSAPSAWSVQIGLIYFAISWGARRRRPHTRMGQAGREKGTTRRHVAAARSQAAR